MDRGHCNLDWLETCTCTDCAPRPTWRGRQIPLRQGEGDSPMTRSWADHSRDDQEGTSGVVADRRVVVHSAKDDHWSTVRLLFYYKNISPMYIMKHAYCSKSLGRLIHVGKVMFIVVTSVSVLTSLLASVL